MGTVVEKLQKALDNKASIKSALLEVGANVTDNMSGYAPEILKFASAYEVIKRLIEGGTTADQIDFDIPTSVTTIRDYAFRGCYGLKINGDFKNHNFNNVSTYAFYKATFKNGLELNITGDIKSNAFEEAYINGDLKIKCNNVNSNAFKNIKYSNDIYIDVNRLSSQAINYLHSYDGNKTYPNVYISKKLENYSYSPIKHGNSTSSMNFYCDFSLQHYIDNITYSISNQQNVMKGGLFETSKNIYFNGVLLPNEIEFNASTDSNLANFSGCKILEKVKIGKGIYCFYGCYNLKEFEFTKNATYTKIPTYMFYSCDRLEKVTINSEYITEITEWAFFTCPKLTYLEIPSSITKITGAALQIGSSSNKVTLVFKGTTPPTTSSNFIPKSNLNKIFVPLGASSTYKSATNLSNYADYIFEPNNVTLSVPSELLNNENYVYAIDNSDEYNQFTSTSLSLENVARIKIKSLTVDTTILVGTTSGGNDIGTISNSELNYVTEGNQTIYLTIQ